MPGSEDVAVVEEQVAIEHEIKSKSGYEKEAEGITCSSSLWLVSKWQGTLQQFSGADGLWLS